MKGENTVMNGAEKKKATPADKAVNAIIVLIILVFVAVGVYATYGKISDVLQTRRLKAVKRRQLLNILQIKPVNLLKITLHSTVLLLAIQSKQRLLKAKCLTI